MLSLLEEGYGNEVVIDPERIGALWAEFPTHLYLNFYVFQYARYCRGACACQPSCR